MNEHNSLPNMRFKGFTDKWKQEKLGNIATVEMNKRIYKNQTNEKGEIPFYKIGTFGKKADSFISNKLFNEYKKKYPYPKVGDILISASGTIGNTIVYKGEDAYFQDSNIVWLNINHNIILNSFLYGFYQIVHWRGIEGSTIKRLYNSNILSTFINYPSVNEQQKIGNLFTKLDKLLYLQQQKIDKLELLKKALLQKLFPKHDTKIPELRFKGYDQEWEEKKFSLLYKKCNEKNNLSFGSNKIISVANMYYKKDNVKSDDNYMKTYNIFRLGDIAFEGHKSKKFTFGRFVENTIGDGIVSHVFEVFRPISNGDITYWKYAIHNEDFIAPILMKSTVKATMMNNLIAKDFLKQRVPVPQLSEQQNIGNLLYKVDQLIELENKKLEDLRQVKKCLLQNMFVE